jgi:hypothetical protein
MVGILEEILSYVSLTALAVTSFTHFEHSDRLLKGDFVKFARTGQGFDTPVYEVCS